MSNKKILQRFTIVFIIILCITCAEKLYSMQKWVWSAMFIWFAILPINTYLKWNDE